jgi:hypothetical protein
MNFRHVQIAADYANKSDTFAVVVQPFLSQSNAYTLDYLSTVSLATVTRAPPTMSLTSYGIQPKSTVRRRGMCPLLCEARKLSNFTAGTHRSSSTAMYIACNIATGVLGEGTTLNCLYRYRYGKCFKNNPLKCRK